MIIYFIFQDIHPLQTQTSLLSTASSVPVTEKTVIKTTTDTTTSAVQIVFDKLNNYHAVQKKNSVSQSDFSNNKTVLLNQHLQSKNTRSGSTSKVKPPLKLTTRRTSTTATTKRLRNAATTSKTTKTYRPTTTSRRPTTTTTYRPTTISRRPTTTTTYRPTTITRRPTTTTRRPTTSTHRLTTTTTHRSTTTTRSSTSTTTQRPTTTSRRLTTTATTTGHQKRKTTSKESKLVS